MRALSRGGVFVLVLIAVLAIALWMTVGERNAAPLAGIGEPERSLPAIPEPASASRGDAGARSEGEDLAKRAPVSTVANPTSGHRLRGRVLEPSGRPAVGAIAGVIGMFGDEPAKKGESATAVCDAGGAFALDVPASLTDELLVVGRKGGFRPASVRMPRDAIEAPLELRLETGCAIEGRVVRNAAGIAGATLSLDLRYGVPGVFGVGNEAFWLAGRFEEKLFTTRADDEGRFRIAGLAPDEYRLDVMHGPLVDLARQVRAPAELTVDVSMPELAILVTESGNPLPDAQIIVAAGTRSTSLQSLAVPSVVAVPLGSTVEVRAEHARSFATQCDVIAPGAGQRLAVVLDLIPQAQTLVGRCEIEIDAETESELRARYHYVDGAGRVWGQRTYVRPAGNHIGGFSFVIASGQNLSKLPERSKVDPLPVGDYTLEVDAEGYEPFRQEISIEEGKTTRAEVRLMTRRG